MDGVDPDTLLEWLQAGTGDERDLQLMALEQLCMLLLMSDNIDRCFESCPPRTFLPALGKIFLDETATENILEVTARAITYYLDVSNECTRRITQVEGAVKAICNRLVVAEMSDRTSKDLAEQCVKLLEHICQREASAVYDAGGLQAMLHLICQHDKDIHKDTMHSAMTVVTRLCSKVEPQDANLGKCSSDLGALLSHDDPKISECALRCFAALTDRFIRKQLDPVELATPSNLVEHLLNALVPGHTKPQETNGQGESGTPALPKPVHTTRTPAFISIVLSLLSNLCRGSAAVTEQVIRSPLLVPAVREVLTSKDERCVMDSLRLADLLIILLCEGRNALPKSGSCSVAAASGAPGDSASSGGFDKTHRHLIDAIRQRDTDALIDAVENGTVDPNFVDDVGQTLLNWCAAFGTSDMVIYLCDKGADPNKGQRSSSLHYAACFGRPDIVKILLQHGANPDLHDEEGRTALDKARERNDEGHQQVTQILESPSSYMVESGKPKAASAPSDKSSSEKQPAISNQGRIPTQQEQVDLELAKNVLQQLVPVFCTIFQNSLVTSIRRSTLALIRKCIFHMQAQDGIQQLLESSAKSDPEEKSGTDFVESLMNVLLTVFNNEEGDVEGKEQALLVMKYLLQKNTEFWLEQLIRLGVYEKVEALANVAEQLSVKCQMQVETKMSTLSIDDTPSISTKSEEASERSATSTPSLSIKSDVDSISTASSFQSNQANAESQERLQMLNIPNIESEETNTGVSEMNTPSPTVEIDRRSASPQVGSCQFSNQSHSISASASKVSSQFAAVRADLVEAANAVAAALGVQIVDDSKSASITSAKSSSKKPGSEDAWKLVQGVSYKWNDWRLIRTKDSLFIWCDAVAIELSDGSNGWLRFLMDGRLQTLYSSGSPEAGADNAESRSEFITKIQTAKQAVPSGNHAKTVFTMPRSKKIIESGNWQIACTELGSLVVTNKEGSQQRIIVKEDLPGFIFESSKASRQQFTAESTLGLDFVTGWAARGGGRRLRFRAEAQRQKLHELAKELWDNYLKEAKTKPREALIELQNSASEVRKLVKEIITAEEDLDVKVENGENLTGFVNELTTVLSKVRDSITNERLLSTFEVSISDIVPALLELVGAALEGGSKTIAKCFQETFRDSRHLSLLVRKMVLVLEANERFPQTLYDTPGGSPFGMQLLTRRLRFRLEQACPEAESQKVLLNRTNRMMKAEPLATVGSLRQFLLGMTSKKWYDFGDRKELSFVREIKEKKAKGEKVSLKFESDFDTNGLIWYLGTNGRTATDWTNPAAIRVINAACSDGPKQPYGQPEDIFSRDVNALNCHTTDSPDSNFTMDLGLSIFPTAYTLRHAQGYGRSALRNWLLQGSKDNHVWDVLVAHSDDQSLKEPGSTCTWPISVEPGQGPYRYLRVAQNGKNSSNSTHFLSLSGFEVYGTIVDVVDSDLKPLEMPPVLQQASRAIQRPTHPISSSFSSSSSAKKQPRKSGTTGSPAIAAKDSSPSASDSKGSPLTNLHYARPPTAASLRSVRKQQKAEKAAAASLAAAINADPTLSVLGVSSNPSVEEENFSQLANSTKLRILRQQRRSQRSNQPPGTQPPLMPPSESQNELQVDVDQNQDEGQATPIASSQNTPTPTSNPENQPESSKTVSKSHGSASAAAERARAGRALRHLRSGQALSSLLGDRYFQESGPSGAKIPKSNIQTRKFGGRASMDWEMKQELEEQSDGSVAIEVTNYNVASGNEDLRDAGLGPNSGTGTSSSMSQQKSMSTTNLFDERQQKPGYSVASTNQAASAESLQHQSPSLENLLARSRIYGERIPEIVGSDGEQTPGSVTPEPRPFGSEEVCQKDDKSSSVDGTATSIAASTFAGGSQPALSSSNITGRKSETQAGLGSSQSAACLEKSCAGAMRLPEPATSSKSLSTSDPDLAFAGGNLQRQRQRSFVPSSSLLDDAMLFMEEDEDQIRQELADTNKSDVQHSSAKESANENLLFGAAAGQPTSSSDRIGAHPAQLLNDLTGDVDCMDQFISQWGLADAYSDMLSGLEGTEGSDPSQAEQAFLQNYALLQELSEHSDASFNNSGSSATAHTAASAALQQLAADRGQNDDSSSSAQSRLLGLRLKLGNYADVAGGRLHHLLRGMVSQVMDIGSLEGEDLDEDIYTDEDFPGHNIIDCDEAEPPTDLLVEDGNGSSHSRTSGNPGSASASIAFQSQVESLASAAAALRRQFSNGTSSGPNSAEPKLNWRQIFMGTDDGNPLTMDGASSSSGFGPAQPNNNAMDDRANQGSRHMKRPALRVWDDEFVLRRQLDALIPAFDPRPGRTNVNQTQEVELSDEPESPASKRKNSSLPRQASSSARNAASKIRLYLKGPNLANVKDEILELARDDASIFYYIDLLLNHSEWGQKTADKNRRVWEPTYILIYESIQVKEPEGEESMPETEVESQEPLVKTTLGEIDRESNDNAIGLVGQSMDLIKQIHGLASKSDIQLSSEVFHSTKLTQKLSQSLTDPLVVSCRVLPSWCDQLMLDYPCLFSVDTRNMHLNATAFGTSRAIVWLQNRRDQLLEQNRSNVSSGTSNLAGSRREDHYPEYRIGRIKHERIKVHRKDDLLLENAIRVMNFHASRKSVLEIEYYGEEGTGLGPTLEFYALLAAEFQRKTLEMWLCDDSDEQQAKLEASDDHLCLGDGEAKPPGFYVRRAGGLFPAFLPQGVNTEECKMVSGLFTIFGIFLAKVLQDNRLVDIPLSPAFLRLILSPQVSKCAEKDVLEGPTGPLTIDDFQQIHPVKANFLRSLQDLVRQKQNILDNALLSPEQKAKALENLRFKLGESDHECSVEDLGLTFAINPPSSIFHYDEIELIENGAKIDVTVHNVEVYVEKCLDYYLHTGIREQVAAFRQGFDQVFPLSSLTSFTPEEVQILLSGEQCPQWTRDDIMKYTEPKLGYTRDSPGFLHFVDVLVDMNASERKSFLQFTTGCSSLPPGGLANLHPRLTVVKKAGEGGDGSYPSVNTCVHYLKLPEYSSAAILRERLLAATYEKGFHLN